MGARKIGVTTLPPLGCLPAAVTIFGMGSIECVARLNVDAFSFNNKLNVTSQRLQARHPGLKLVVLDIYQPLLDLVINSSQHGTPICLSDLWVRIPQLMPNAPKLITCIFGLFALEMDRRSLIGFFIGKSSGYT